MPSGNEFDSPLAGAITASATTLHLTPSAEPAPFLSSTNAFSSSKDDLALTAGYSEGANPLADPIDPPAKQSLHFQWGPAIRQSFKLLAIQQGMMLGTDKWARWSVSHGKFFRDYVGAVSGGLRQWDDGDPFLDNYVGHPLQGAVSGFIQVQNDPFGRVQTFGKTKPYWKSRLKALGWIAMYSTQFEIGPISESSIENLGNFYYQNCPTCKLTRGAGWVDIVVTPTLGVAWLIGEDAIDRYLIRRIENKVGPGKWSNFFRTALNPARVAANALRLKAPWYRDNRDTEAGPLN